MVSGERAALLTKPVNSAAGDLRNPGSDHLRWSILGMFSGRFSYRPHNV
jgi:hypothetical protein